MLGRNNSENHADQDPLRFIRWPTSEYSVIARMNSDLHDIFRIISSK